MISIYLLIVHTIYCGRYAPLADCSYLYRQSQAVSAQLGKDDTAACLKWVKKTRE
jgi:hypothetical protein